ncbi:MAG: exodeoxyribonuclease V subunit beta [Chromatiales bacterium]
MSCARLDTAAVLGFPLTGIRLIEASAGTGKTYTIANLYVRHIVEGREVGQVLVVTFTVAATDELRGRIRARLFETLDLLERGGPTDDGFLSGLIDEILRQGRGDTVIRRLRLAVRAMDEAAVYTIHSFCQRALTEFAFNSGQQFQTEVLTDDSALWREAVQDWWRRTGYPLDRAGSRLFSASLGTLEAFRALLAPLLGPQPKRLLPEVGPVHAVLARFDAMVPELRALADVWRHDGARLTGVLQTSKGLSRSQRGPYHRDSLAAALAAVDAWLAEEEVLPPPDAFEVLTAQCIEAHRLQAPDPDLFDPFFARCGAVREDLARLKRDLRAAALAEAAEFSRGRVREAKQKAQVLSFDDLLTEMHAALGRGNGEALAESVRGQFPVAMIDEFQDTDPVQYGIFRRLYLDRPECGLIMIGDPKQAIYSFRGGDIFTYMQAKEDVGEGGIYTLDTNWRSTPEVVHAVGAVFARRAGDAFVYGETIPVSPVRAADKTHRHLRRGGERQPALTLWTLPPQLNAKGEERALSKESAGELTHAAVADEVARLVAEGRAGGARLGERALAPRDIAVLVRTSYEAADLRTELAARGVGAVSVGREGVFGSEEAAALETLLQAVLNPRDRDLARLALTSPLLGKDYAEIDRVSRGEEEWTAWVDGLLQLQEVWLRRGFMPMFQRMLRGMEIARALSRGELAERRLTNLLHLGELLQQASKAHAGTDALLSWYRQQREESAAEEAELRLESDEELVQIVTIHASKGLQYPLVFVPYLWGCRPRTTDGLLGFHLDREACLDAGSDAIDDHLLLAEQERLAEDVRLVYVALTRAESALYLVWGRAGSRDGHAGQTALGYLLHPRQEGSALRGALPDAFAGLADLGPDLDALAAAAGGDILVRPLPAPGGAPGLRPAEAPPALAPRPFTGRVATDWRVSSFTALTRDLHSGPAAPRDEIADDPAMGFPAGSHVGSYLHLLLEKLDFQGEVERQVLAHSREIAPRFNLDHARWGRDAAVLLERVTRTPLDPEGLALAGLDPDRRLNELEFDFATGAVDVAALNRLLEKAAGGPLAPLELEAFQGMVTGVIDLVFEHAGRFYIADYKSNFLGGRFEDYGGERLRTAVYERRYDLQYLLYTLALHRYLGRRLPAYDYGRHFGGVYYLFLRGMRPETGAGCGVYFDRPARDLVEALDRQVFRHGPAGAA